MKGNQMTKQLFLIRGLPGSGKTTLARKLCGYSKGIMIAADDYFYRGATNEMGEGTGYYDYDASYISDAHSVCQSRTKSAMTNEAPAIFIHNTFVKQWMINQYLELAKMYGYEVTVITCNGKFKSEHAPDWAIERMANEWEQLS